MVDGADVARADRHDVAVPAAACGTGDRRDAIYAHHPHDRLSPLPPRQRAADRLRGPREHAFPGDAARHAEHQGAGYRRPTAVDVEQLPRRQGRRRPARAAARPGVQDGEHHAVRTRPHRHRLSRGDGGAVGVADDRHAGGVPRLQGPVLDAHCESARHGGESSSCSNCTASALPTLRWPTRKRRPTSPTRPISRPMLVRNGGPCR